MWLYIYAAWGLTVFYYLAGDKESLMSIVCFRNYQNKSFFSFFFLLSSLSYACRQDMERKSLDLETLLCRHQIFTVSWEHLE